jgi:hypothetical protein
MNVTRRMIVIPVAAVMAAGIGAGAFAVGLTAARNVPEAVTQDTTFFVNMDGQQEFSAGGVAGVCGVCAVATVSDIATARTHPPARRSPRGDFLM